MSSPAANVSEPISTAKGSLAASSNAASKPISERKHGQDTSPKDLLMTKRSSVSQPEESSSIPPDGTSHLPGLTTSQISLEVDATSGAATAAAAAALTIPTPTSDAADGTTTCSLAEGVAVIDRNAAEPATAETSSSGSAAIELTSPQPAALSSAGPLVSSSAEGTTQSGPATGFKDPEHAALFNIGEVETETSTADRVCLECLFTS